MKINNINYPNTKQNFKGAYILKGTAKSLIRFDEEMKLQSVINNKFTNILSYELTPIYSNTQPYAELLVCTGEHIKNLRRNLIIEHSIHQAKIEKFAQDFHSWSDEKKQKWNQAIQEAVRSILDGETKPVAPGEEELAKGNADIFLDWYSKAIKNSNELYKNISRLGAFPFPEKIRRLDADKVTDAIIANNFNIKEGFFRNYKNPPKVEIDEEDGVTIRYINGKIDSVINYETIGLPQFPEPIKSIKSYSKVNTDKNGKISNTKTLKFGF